MAISDKKIQSLKPGKTKRRINIDGRAGRGIGRLMLDVHPSGRKAFLFRYILAGKRRFVTIGPYDPNGNGHGTFTLAQASRSRENLSAQLKTHGDLKTHLKGEQERTEAERRKAEQERAKQGTFGELLAAYVEKLKHERKRSAREVENAFRLHVREATPDLIDRKAVEITPADVHRILSQIAAAGRTRQVNKVRSMLATAFNYAATAAYDPRRSQSAAAFGLESNPVALTMRVQEFDRAGERVLSTNELAAYWRHLDQVPNLAVRAFLRVALLLAGQRIEQLLRLRAPDINIASRIIRLRDAKGRNGIERDHLLPLSERVEKILENGPHIEGAKQWMFSTDGRTAIRPETISNAVSAYSDWLASNTEATGIKVEPFLARDLRRTCETRLAELGVTKDIRAQLLSHGISGVQAKHYDRYSYLAEKGEALMRWEAYLDELLDPERKIVNFTHRNTGEHAPNR